jgi:hypothetical protein
MLPQRGLVKVRNRPATIGALGAGMAALVCLSWVAFQHRPVPQPRLGDNTRPAREPTRRADDLTVEDEAALRAIVSEHFLATAYWAPGGADPYDPIKRFRVLVLPREVREIYERKPVGTLRTLKRIIESGSSADAHTAIAYAHAAVGYANDAPAPLMHARIYADFRTAKDFDKLHRVVPKTYRQLAVEEIDRLIADVKKKQKDKRAEPRKE